MAVVMAVGVAALGSGCAPVAGNRGDRHTGPARAEGGVLATDPVAALNRLTWGVNEPAVATLDAMGPSRYLVVLLHPGHAPGLPAEIQVQVDALSVGHEELRPLLAGLREQRRVAEAMPEGSSRAQALRAYQERLNGLARDAASRQVLRALYGTNPLREQLTWFWFNHFNVYRGKADLRAMVGDYEERAIRPNVLGHFRDLLRATAFHPAMLRYLDNEHNAAGHINENYARELLELHTLGVDGGYTQHDVQELARVLTGLGVSVERAESRPGRRPAPGYRREGAVEFNPRRHDYGDKLVLGHTIHGRGVAEIEEVLDLLARHPATARHVSRQLAGFLVAENPPAALVERMAQTFQASDGDIATTVALAIDSPEFAASLGHLYRDPMHYVLAAVRLACGDRVILNTAPVLGWLEQLGEAPYAHPTPEGYPLDEAAWASPEQLTARFGVARAIGNGSAGLFRAAGEPAAEHPAFPRLANALFFRSLEPRLGPATRSALGRAASPQEWNQMLLSSPEMMYR